MKPDKTAETESTQLETEVESASRAPAARFGLPALTLLFHPDATRTGERITLPDLTSRGTVELSRLTPEFSAPGKTRKRPLADRRLSRRPLRLQPGRATGAVLLDPGSTPTSVYLGEELLRDAIELTHDEIEHGVILRLANRVVLLLHFVDPLAQRDLPDYGLIGASDALTQVRQDIRQVADLDVPVLVRGETGTGKELVAQAIHRASPRVDRPYVTVSMAAIPPTLAAAELFGAVKGAFTGADRHRQGYFRRAAGGTLFLDEIGETPEELQVLLLRCLESSEIQPVGADRTEKVDVRLITATDLDLEEAVAARRFRAPLLHRLNGYEITVPPLRQRRDDFGRLFFHFLRRELDAIGQAARLDLPQSGQKPWMSAALCARLAAFDWPGNVRQLRNVAR
ncbi:MAG: sigma 54-interacting transcriptional regulator, partial [Acidobacteriota bacterium]